MEFLPTARYLGGQQRLDEGSGPAFFAARGLWLSGCYWGLNAAVLIGEAAALDAQKIAEQVAGARHPDGGYGGGDPIADAGSHVLHTLSAIQLLALLGERLGVRGSARTRRRPGPCGAQEAEAGCTARWIVGLQRTDGYAQAAARRWPGSRGGQIFQRRGRGRRRFAAHLCGTGGAGAARAAAHGGPGGGAAVPAALPRRRWRFRPPPGRRAACRLHVLLRGRSGAGGGRGGGGAGAGDAGTLAE